jgi:hypothetical protein
MRGCRSTEIDGPDLSVASNRVAKAIWDGKEWNRVSEMCLNNVCDVVVKCVGFEMMKDNNQRENKKCNASK